MKLINCTAVIYNVMKRQLISYTEHAKCLEDTKYHSSPNHLLLVFPFSTHQPAFSHLLSASICSIPPSPPSKVVLPTLLFNTNHHLRLSFPYSRLPYLLTTLLLQLVASRVPIIFLLYYPFYILHHYSYTTFLFLPFLFLGSGSEEGDAP